MHCTWASGFMYLHSKGINVLILVESENINMLKSTCSVSSRQGHDTCTYIYMHLLGFSDLMHYIHSLLMEQYAWCVW